MRWILMISILGLTAYAWAESLPQGKKCTSSLECGDGLRCDPAQKVCIKAVLVGPKEGCDRGNAQACGQLAATFLEAGASAAGGSAGDGPKNLPKAVEYFRKGCDGGDAFSCYKLGGIYVGLVGDSDGVPKDIALAVQYWRTGCDGKNMYAADACFALGMAYQKGAYGIPRTPTKVAKYFQKACDNGHADACAAVDPTPRTQTK